MNLYILEHVLHCAYMMSYISLEKTRHSLQRNFHQYLWLLHRCW